jgi:hypothetical protein
MATLGSKNTSCSLNIYSRDNEGKKKSYQVNGVLGQRGDAMGTFCPSHHLASKSAINATTCKLCKLYVKEEKKRLKKGEKKTNFHPPTITKVWFSTLNYKTG